METYGSCDVNSPGFIYPGFSVEHFVEFAVRLFLCSNSPTSVVSPSHVLLGTGGRTTDLRIGALTQNGQPLGSGLPGLTQPPRTALSRDQTLSEQPG